MDDNRRVLKNRMSALKDCEPWEMWSWGDFIESLGIDRSSNWEDTVDRVCRLIGGDPEREKAADWVEVNGGLVEVSGKLDAYDAIDDERGYLMELRAEVAARLGVGLDGIAPVEAHARMLGELDKRLMPLGMEWPRFEDGKMVKIGDEYIANGKTKTAANFLFDGKKCALNFTSDFGTLWIGAGERVKRPAVLAADGLPIREGETVWYDGAEYVVDRVYTASDGGCSVDLEFGDLRSATNVWPQLIDHTPPDTQERIDDNSHLNPIPYARDVLHRDNWDKLTERQAFRLMIDDLMRRQRELDEHTMGGE